MNNANQHLFQLQLPLFTYSCLRGKQTNGGGSGWSIEGCKKYNELFMAVNADRKKNAKQFNPQLLLFYQAQRRRKLQAKHNAKDNSRPKAKAAYHCVNELEGESDEEEMPEEKGDFSDTEEDSDNDNDNDNDNVNGLLNVFAFVNCQVVYHKCNNEHMTTEIVHYHSKICMQSHQNII